MKVLDNFIELIEKKIFGKHIYHRNHCKKEGRCISCGRYICSGCNAFCAGRYGYCMECQAKVNGNYKNITALPFKPLFKPYKIKRFNESCNNHPHHDEDY